MLQVPPPQSYILAYTMTNKENLTRLLPAIAPERALAILKAFVEGATKREIVRVFDIREGAVRAVIETARKAS
jgi:DNA-directed RNA polymerase specialized sigma24 family protein